MFWSFVLRLAWPSTERKADAPTTDHFVGEPVPDHEARRRWPHRYINVKGSGHSHDRWYASLNRFSSFTLFTPCQTALQIGKGSRSVPGATTLLLPLTMSYSISTTMSSSRGRMKQQRLCWSIEPYYIPFLVSLLVARQEKKSS